MTIPRAVGPNGLNLSGLPFAPPPSHGRPPSQDELAELTAGYCGADMKALCSEATLLAVRR